MTRCRILLLLVSVALFAADPAYDRAEAKLTRLENREFKPGEVIVFTPAEVDAWVRVVVPEVAPEGIRDPRLELGPDSATAYATVDFLKLRENRGKVTSPLVAKMLEGERPLKVSARITSGGGRCTVYLTRVELAGVVLEGATLDFLIKNFFVPRYPNAKINQPFELDDADRIDFRPDGIKVTIKAAP